MSSILVIVEIDSLDINTLSKEALSAGARFATKHNFELSVFVVGICSEDIANKISLLSVSNIYSTDAKVYSQSLYLSLLHKFIKDNSIDYIIAGATLYSYEYLPMLSAKLNSSISTDVYAFDLDKEQNGIKVKRLYYTGKLVEERVLIKKPIILSIRQQGYRIDTEDKITAYKHHVLSSKSDDVKILIKAILKESVDDSTKDLTKASIIISGGLGLKSEANFALLEELGELIGGSVAASRAAVERGWRPYKDQIGQTGKIVSPLLYIACGISGAMQHIVGIKQSKYIIAINKDKSAPIFNYADYCIIDDATEVLPILISGLKSVV